MQLAFGMLLDPTPLFTRTPFVPVLTIENAAQAVPLARSLLAGGLSVIEVTLRTSAALAAVKSIIADLPHMIVGVGTVTRGSDIRAAEGAGARFLVSPGTPAWFADELAAASVPALPGCATVSEAMALAERGFKLLKFFPAEASGGVAWLKAVAEPLPNVKFCPTGGITKANARDYLVLPNVVAVGGSWTAPRDLIVAGGFGRISALAAEAAALLRG